MNAIRTSNDFFNRLYRLPLFRWLSHPATITVYGSFWLVVSALSEPLFADEGLWGYQGWLWVHYGSPPYIGSVENKGPGIASLFAIGELVFGHQYWFARMMGILCLLATGWLLYRIGERWRDRWTGLIAMSVYCLASAWKSFDGPYTAQTETFMNFFIVLAFYWVAMASSEEVERPKRLVAAGIAMGMAIAFKQIAIVSVGALCYFAIARLKPGDLIGKKFWKVCLWLGAGILLATAVSLIPLWVSGVTCRDYVEGAWLILLNPGSTQLRTFASSMESLSRPDMLVFYACFVFLWKRKSTFELKKIPLSGLLAWMIFSYLAVQSQGWYHRHNYKLTLPCLALAAGLSVQELIDMLPIPDYKINAARTAALWFLIVGMTQVRDMPKVGYSLNLLLHPAPIMEKTLGEWLHQNTSDKDLVYIYGSIRHQPGNRLEFYAARRSPSRYFNDHFIDPPAIAAQVAQDIMSRPPRFIAVWDNMPPEWLQDILRGSFAYRFNMARYWVYENTKLR